MMDENKTLAHDIGTLLQSSARQGLLHYRPIVAKIINGEMDDPKEIELTLDYMLDYCYYDEVLTLYKSVCRSLYDKHPALVYNAVMNYKEVWDSDEHGGDSE
jgi:hypothetical protein